jgi:hypothetical protein
MKKRGMLLALALLFSISLVSANTAPIIGELETEHVICEGTQFSQTFSATDPNGTSLTPDISPKGPFYTRVLSTDPQKTIIEIFSVNITKEFADQVFETTLSVSDGELIDSRKLKFKTFETNNKPKIEKIGATTVSLNRSSKLLKQVHVSDIESGNEESGNLTFMIAAENISLTISENGLINGSFESNDTGLHEIKVCVTDNGVKNIQEKIGFCGSDEIKETTCETFQLSVVGTNAQPTVLEYNTTNLSSRFPGKTPINFEVIKFDPNEIVPDTYWYVDNSLKRVDVGKAKDSFTYEFGCDIWGKHRVRAEITDGLDKDTLSWEFDIIRVNCAEDELPGGIIGPNNCEEDLACNDWNLCQNAAQSAEIGSISARDLELINKNCEENGWGNISCGFQIRECTDKNSCGLNNNFQFQACYFSQDPTCSDGLMNCHSSSCETLVDCGGPCNACPTCSDRKQNQGEEYIDCGGPCSVECPDVIVPPEEVKLKKIILIVIGILVAIALILVLFIVREKRKLQEPSIHEKPVQNTQQTTQQNDS